MENQERVMSRRALREQRRHRRILFYRMISTICMVILIYFTIQFLGFVIWLRAMNRRNQVAMYADGIPPYIMLVEEALEEEDDYAVQVYRGGHYTPRE